MCETKPDFQLPTFQGLVNRVRLHRTFAYIVYVRARTRTHAHTHAHAHARMRSKKYPIILSYLFLSNIMNARVGWHSNRI